MDAATTPVEALREAVRRIGGQSALARELGVSQPTVWYWLNHKIIPAEQAEPIEKATNVPKWLLRPDLFEAPSDVPFPPPVRDGDPSSVGPSGSIVACDRAALSHRGDA